ncbi:hypothetical protein [Streptomyces roseoverticillatus]|uniref:hypothetical protein n=1 Tax=Streptomyces roseoverticillatus TaxID=66429 RepID=UPI0012FEF941|nr:hypothetical protein [Streptomyces roseoverticillatus]
MVDERDDLFSTRAALHAHRPQEGRITVQPTPANGSPAALAHDVLYALGKRFAPGPDNPDVWLDSADLAWRAAAAWSKATGVRHVVVTRAHLLTGRRVDQLLVWRRLTGAQMTLLWHKAPHRLPAGLAQVRCVSDPGQFASVLAEPGPVPAHPCFPSAPTGVTGPVTAAPGPTPVRPGCVQSASRVARPGRVCAGAAATAQLAPATPANAVAPVATAALAAVAHPLIAGALSVVAFTGGSLRWTRDLDITGDISVVKTHEPGHRSCRLSVVPAWARPLLAATRAFHRLTPQAPENVFGPLLLAEARHLRAHAERLPQGAMPSPSSFLAP